MIHVDRTQHTAILSPHSKENLILPAENQLRDWAELSPKRLARIPSPTQPEINLPGPTTPKDNQPITANPETRSSPPSPIQEPSTSPNREHSSSSLSPIPDTTHSSPTPATTNSLPNTEAASAEQATDDKESRQSTPLSELSPPPDDDDPPSDEKKDVENSVDEAVAKKEQDVENKPLEKPSSSTNPYPSHSSNSAPSPSASPNHPSSYPSGKDPKVSTILELNAELFKILLELQARGVNSSDMRFQSFATRLQSNLNFLATAADRPSTQPMTYPMMEAPPTIDLISTDRIQQLYAELVAVFPKSRRPSLGANPPNNYPSNHLKRERPDEVPLDMMNHKRRDTGEGKSNNNGMMLPPPSLPLQEQLSNGLSASPSPSIGSGSSPMTPQTSAIPGMISPVPGPGSGSTVSLSDGGMSEAQLAQGARDPRMANMRMSQQQRPGGLPGMPSTPQPQQGRHMSPPSSSGGPSSNVQISPTSSNHGPSNMMPGGGGGLSTVQQMQQQAYSLLQSQPPHPILQYMHRMVPNFGTLSFQDQAKRIFQVLQMRQQQQQQQHSQQSVQHQQQMGANSMPNGAFGNHSSPISPVSQQAQMNPMMAQGMNAGSSSMIGGVGGAGSSGGLGGIGGGSNNIGNMGSMNLSQMTPNQRQQLMLMHQQRSGMGVGGMNPMNPMNNMNNINGMSSQQYAMMQQQRQQQAQQSMTQGVTSPTQQPALGGGNGSPMIPGNDFPALRSNAAIPGIARSARSPPDGGMGGGGMGMGGVPGSGNQSPMTPRMPTRGASMGQDDFTRMMNGGGGPSSRGGMMPGPGSNNFSSQQMQNWQQQMGSGMGGGMGGPHSANVHGGGYGGSGGSMGAPSPPGSAGSGFGSGASGGHSGDLSSSNLGLGMGMPRHMSATPGSGQQMRNPNLSMNGMNGMNNMNNMNNMMGMGMGMNMNSSMSS
ncbi:hypothetical protein EV361DRAFT_886163 [Lentinula raphanica]|nr:hypothetical protein EV361DRAFT_886163 [Lentinula raphanica]